MPATQKKVAVLIEGDFYEHESGTVTIDFPEAGIQVDFMSRLWGQPSLTFKGHEYHAPFECSKSFETIDDAELQTYAAVIVPSGIVSDRLRYTESQSQLPPASAFLKRAFSFSFGLEGHHLPRTVADGADHRDHQRPAAGLPCQPARRCARLWSGICR